MSGRERARRSNQLGSQRSMALHGEPRRHAGRWTQALASPCRTLQAHTASVQFW
jgi:hypothetical protein